MSVEAYPLAWPAGWRRTPDHERTRARFGVQQSRTSVHSGNSYTVRESVSISEGTQRLLAELIRLGVLERDVVISTNLALRNDGLPRSAQRAPADPGVAVYWTLDGAAQCLAIDLYDRVADNLAAVAATVAAMRAIERHGGAQILKRAFQGFKALPAANGTAHGLTTLEAWQIVAGFAGRGNLAPDRSHARDVVRAARAATHPDRQGGSSDNFTMTQRAAETLGAAFGEKL